MPLSRLLRRAVAVFLLVVALAAIACGGDDGEDAVTLDPARGDELAHAAIIEPGDLPGTGWTVTETDQFDDNLTGFGDTAACKALAAKLDQGKAERESGRTGRAQTQISQQGSDVGAPPTDVSVEINVFKDAKIPADAMETFRDALGGDFEKCLDEGLRASLTESGVEGVEVKISTPNPAASAPEEGLGKAFDVEINAGGLSFKLRFEAYLWRFGNVGVSVFMSGPAEAVNADLVKAAVDKTKAGLEAAAK